MAAISFCATRCCKIPEIDLSRQKAFEIGGTGVLFEPAPPAGAGLRFSGRLKIPAQNFSKFYTKPFVFAYEIESGILQHLVGFHLCAFYYVGNGFLLILSSILDHFGNSQRAPARLWGPQQFSKRKKVGDHGKGGFLQKQ